MTSTIVRLEGHTHATLKEWAEQQHKSIGQTVTELVDQEATDRFWQDIHESYGRLRADSKSWKDYQEEAAMLQGGSMDGLQNEEPYFTPEEELEIERFARSQGW